MQRGQKTPKLPRGKAGQVGRLTPGDRETARALSVRVGRAGTRLGKSVNAWTVDGVVYFKLD